MEQEDHPAWAVIQAHVWQSQLEIHYHEAIISDAARFVVYAGAYNDGSELPAYLE
jgi:hypothetical protein